MPKATRGPGPGQLRPHSRSSSNSKLGANLQFTQKDNASLKNADKSKKAAYTHEAHPTKPSFTRVNSSQRVHSREQLALAPKRSAYPQHQAHQQQQHHHQQQQPPAKAANGKGFSLANENADDDDEWESSNSGAGTPNHRESDSSDTASEAEALDQAILNLQIAARVQPSKVEPPPPLRVDSTLARVDTARPADFETLATLERNAMRPITPPKQLQSQQQAQPLPPLAMPPPPPPQAQVRWPKQEMRRDAASDSSDSRQSSRPKRHSRPPSTHSNQSRQEPLRPHPLIRGLSHGAVNSVLPKPSPLAPLTVVPHAAPQISGSPVSSIHDGGHRPFLSSSPTSVKTSSGSPVSVDRHPFPLDRRTSFSSARSVNTIPVHSTLIRESPWAHDRSRTLSTMSSSSSAALSALSHLPTVTRPPSPQTIAFFPPTNPHANVDGIHPLLPTPYLQNHLTVLSRRTPIRESFDRVIQAKNQNRR